SIGLNHILSAFVHGAGGVIVASCHTGNCASVYGTILARERSAQARTALAEAGYDPETLVHVTLAANAPDVSARAYAGLKARLA
ncbi:MAG: hydrogenase iron-sulfur subunit, partial [Pseudomonadota bacterium]